MRAVQPQNKKSKSRPITGLVLISAAILQLVKDTQLEKAPTRAIKLEQSHSKTTAPDKPEYENKYFMSVILEVSQYLILIALVKDLTCAKQ